MVVYRGPVVGRLSCQGSWCLDVTVDGIWLTGNATFLESIDELMKRFAQIEISERSRRIDIVTVLLMLTGVEFIGG